MKSRIIIIFVALTFFWLGLVFRSLLLQVFPDEKLLTQKKRQFQKKIKLMARRGAIYDRKGKELAITVPSYSLFVDPFILKEPQKNSKIISKLLNLSTKKVYKKMTAKSNNQRLRRFVWIKRHLSEELRDDIRNLKIRGLGFIEEPLRIYPNDHLLSQALGFVSRDGRGLEGVELSFDSYLKGKTQVLSLQKDARGRPLVLDGMMFSNHPEGKDITLTIDSELQFFLEKELESAIVKYKADSAHGIILEAHSSEIISMANVPRYNNNKPSHYLPSYRRNRVITDIIEPGSTMKSVVVASALQKNLLKPNTKINCGNGKLKIGRRVITEADDSHKFSELTVSEVLSHSSNVGTAKIAFLFGEKELKSSLNDFGFGVKTGIDLVGEVKGLVSEKKWSKHRLATASFGHGIGTTMIQVANAYAAIANGGVLNQPTILKNIEGESRIHSKKGKRVLSEKVSQTMRIMLTSATSKGSTGFNARVLGYQVAGKTGTAQKVDLVHGGYKKGEYISSFVGFIPAHKPRYVIYIVVDNPKEKYYGSQVAAPLFSKVAGFSIRQTDVSPVLLSEKNFLKKPTFFHLNKNTFNKNKKKKVRINELTHVTHSNEDVFQQLKGQSLRTALRLLEKEDLKFDVRGEGRIWKLSPSSLAQAQKKGQLQIILKR